MVLRWPCHNSRGVLDDVASVSYEVSEAEYNAACAWVQALLSALDANIAWLQPLLTQVGQL